MPQADSPVRGRIFISYRREETAYPAGWLVERLKEEFGEDQVFRDVDSIQLGDDFVEVIEKAVGSCDVLLALIGNEWLTIVDEGGRRRIEQADDFVRLEIEAALARRIRVIPVLVEGARMPRAEELPPTLSSLSRRHALELSPRRFDLDTEELLEVLEKTLAEVRGKQPKTARVGRVSRTLRTHARLSLGVGAGILVLASAVLAGVLFFSGTGSSPIPTPTASATPRPVPRGEGWSVAKEGLAFAGLTDVAASTAGTGAIAVGTNGSRPKIWAYNSGTWSRVPGDQIDGGSGRMNAVAVAGSTAIAVGSIDYTASDVDGMVWQRDPAGRWKQQCRRDVCGGEDRQQILAVSYVNGEFIAVGRKKNAGNYDAAVWRSSDDGSTWQPVTDNSRLGGPRNQSANGVVGIGNRIVVVGSDDRSGAAWVSTDQGAHWGEVRAQPAFSKSGHTVEILAVGKQSTSSDKGQTLVAVGREFVSNRKRSEAAAWFSQNGDRWTRADISDEQFSGQQMVALVDAQPDLIAVGNASLSRAGVWRFQAGKKWTPERSGAFDSGSGMSGVAMLGNRTKIAVGTAIWSSKH